MSDSRQAFIYTGLPQHTFIVDKQILRFSVILKSSIGGIAPLFESFHLFVQILNQILVAMADAPVQTTRCLRQALQTRFSSTFALPLNAMKSNIDATLRSRGSSKYSLRPSISAIRGRNTSLYFSYKSVVFTRMRLLDVLQVGLYFVQRHDTSHLKIDRATRRHVSRIFYLVIAIVPHSGVCVGDCSRTLTCIIQSR